MSTNGRRRLEGMHASGGLNEVVFTGAVRRRVVTNAWLSFLFVASTFLESSNIFLHFIKVIESLINLLPAPYNSHSSPLASFISNLTALFTALISSSHQPLANTALHLLSRQRTSKRQDRITHLVASHYAYRT